MSSSSNANSRQVGGDHYKTEIEHWDFIESNGIGYLEGCATKYVTRARKKNGAQDLEKAIHYVDKILDLERQGVKTAPGIYRWAVALLHTIKNRKPVVGLPATGITVEAFCTANALTHTESRIIALIAGWNAAVDLQIARAMIVELKDGPTPRLYADD